MLINFRRQDGREGMMRLPDPIETGHAVDLIALVEDGAEFSPALTPEIIEQARTRVLEMEARKQAADEAMAKVGLVREGGRFIAPSGHIVVTDSGPAEEYLPGFRRLPEDIHVRGTGRVYAKMVDAEGFGEYSRIIGVTPHRVRKLQPDSWVAGKSHEEIEKTIEEDGARE